ncbi:preprotein translocase subunit SecY [Buchnera aphidicola (Pemphigus obesinymphae)]|uniref:preprotein translocase subunit SecY n=1 Tax=Buchnera aphidicola TaxID=9 RepID=UPI002237AB2C|nr:preprotein translocase subunit SecY [Buchnera aphidicola]MCW5196401.1 preprotein translocase subunit SecY [Buchnera aphidicola (Pemphigus obesinymphae)]
MVKKLGLDYQKYHSGFNILKKRVLFIIMALIIFRIGSFIPIPGIDVTMLSRLLERQQGTIIEIFNMFSGGALSRASIFALGIMPYISASIIIQLSTLVYPRLIEIKKEGESGRRKINRYIRYTTLLLAILQSIGIAISLPNMPALRFLIIHPDLYFYCIAVFSLVTGTIFLMWLGELITEKGLGNGISIIIFSGIIAGLPSSIGSTLEQVRLGELNFMLFLFVIFFIFSIIFLVVLIERSQRKINVHYAKRQQGRRIYAAQSSYLPLKVNMSGVIPAIFASSIILFPATIFSWFGDGSKLKWLMNISFYLQPNKFVYMFLYALAIIFFCFFYTSVVFNSRETAENLKKSGAFIPGIRPGEKTARYINKIMLRLTLIGSMYITFICLIPELMRFFIHVPFYFGGTSLLIVVVVIIDFISQVQTLIMSTQYESALKKSKLNFKGIYK